MSPFAAITLAAQQAQTRSKPHLVPPPPKASPWARKHWRNVRDELKELARADATTTSAPPLLQFQGNVTTFQPISSNTVQALLREGNCSLSLMTVLTGSGYTLLSTTPNYQDTLHKLAQLTTTPDKFTGGCADGWPGRMSHFATLVGQTSQGDYVGAISQLNGTETALTTYVYDGSTLSSTSNPTGENTQEFVVGDLNGDGINDIVAPVSGAAGATSGSVAVLLGNADGSFKPVVNYPVPFIPAGIVLQDFNGDGKLDVAVTGGDANSNHFIGVLPGKGDGTLGTAVTSSGGGGYFFLISADFNGDGKMDIAVQDGEILLGKGDGTFTPGPQPWNSGSNDFYTGMVAGDFNRDGKIDMAVVSSASDEVQIWLGNGDGTFALKSTYAAIFGGFNIGVSDLDGDGNIDLVIGTTGGGGFATDDNTAGDFQVLMGNGDGTFQAATVFPEFGTAQSGTGGVRSFAVGDLNGDGNQDLLGLGQTTSSQPALSTRFGNGKGSFTQGPVSAMQVTNEFALQTGDFNGDGKLDAVTLGTTSASDNTPSVHIYLGNGDGSFQPGVNYTLPATPSNMAVGDLNGDGKPDVVALTASGVYLLLNKGDGTLGTPKLVDGTPTTAAVAVIADLNGDGKADLVVLQDGNLYSTPPVPGNVLVYLGNGDGTFGAATTYLANTYSDGGLTIADVNGDGKLDILATTGTIGSGSTFVSNSVLNVLLGKGDGTFQSPITTAQLDEVPFLTVITVADFNQDGKLDVAQGDCCGLGDTYIFFGNGDGTFQTPVSLGVGVSSTSLTTANLKGDKYPDLMLANTGSYRYPDVVVLLNLYGANLMAQPVATATTLTASPTSATTGTAVTLTAVVKESPGSAIPTGSVTFLDGTATLGVGTLDATGTASFSTSLLTAGTHSLTANYGGDANNGGSASSEITVIITQPTPTFTFALNPATGTVSSGSTVATTATITPSGGFNQATTFACSGLPANATCSFSPATVTPSSGAVTTTLTIATGVQAAISPARSVPGRGTALAFLFGGLVACLAGLGRGRRRRFTWLLVIAAAVIAGAISACGGGGGSGSGGGGGGTTTPSGTSTVTITATAGTLSKTATFTLTVQ